ncbi:MAG: hypothetical protein HWE20_03880 [Gammaproteobacteria bacterium]|nr:hypothetical protein [Gammaproteobacteria bacterium]
MPHKQYGASVIIDKDANYQLLYLKAVEEIQELTQVIHQLSQEVDALKSVNTSTQDSHSS